MSADEDSTTISSFERQIPPWHSKMKRCRLFCRTHGAIVHGTGEIAIFERSNHPRKRIVETVFDLMEKADTMSAFGV